MAERAAQLEEAWQAVQEGDKMDSADPAGGASILELSGMEKGLARPTDGSKPSTLAQTANAASNSTNSTSGGKVALVQTNNATNATQTASGKSLSEAKNVAPS